MLRVVAIYMMSILANQIASGDLEAAKHTSLLYLLVFCAGAVIGSVGDLVSHAAENKTYGALMHAFHHKLTTKDMSFYRDNQTGYLATAFRHYSDSTMMAVRGMRGEITRVAISITVPVILLFKESWAVGLVSFGLIIVQILYMLWVSSKANTYREQSHEVYKRLTGEVSDQITNIVAYKSSGMESSGNPKVSKLISDELRTYWRRRRVTVLLDLPRMLATGVGTALAIYLVANGNAAMNQSAVGLIVLIIMFMFQISRNVQQLPDIISDQDDYISRIYPLLRYLTDDGEMVKDPDHPKPLRVLRGEIVITAISFSYSDSNGTPLKTKVLDNFSLHIAGGEQVGIVGLSGAGKSTLADLIMRFDDVQEGSIEIDGMDIRDVSQNELRKHIAYVPQEPLLFHRSIRENITYYNTNATEDDIISAAKAAHAHEFISELPSGYNTLVGERGIKLSGGQKQRVVIARAILKKAPIMIFDEATSALDSESEQIIQSALPKILGQQTAIVIAHRLSTIANLDRIIVMHGGKIVEEGTHKQLLRNRGRYHSLWQKQTRRAG